MHENKRTGQVRKLNTSPFNSFPCPRGAVCNMGSIVLLQRLLGLKSLVPAVRSDIIVNYTRGAAVISVL